MNEVRQRLRQRKLVQWRVAYVAAAFALLQGIDIVAQQFGWSGGGRRGITLVMVIGFFVTLVPAWYQGERGEQRVTGTDLLIQVLLLAFGGGFLWRFVGISHQPATISAAVPAAIPRSSPNEFLTALQHLLVTSYSGPPGASALLRLDPEWDSLRGDPRFEQLAGQLPGASK